MNKYWVDVLTKILFLCCLVISIIQLYGIFNMVVAPNNPLIPKVLFTISAVSSIVFVVPYWIVGFLALRNILSKTESVNFIVISFSSLIVFSVIVFPVIQSIVVAWFNVNTII